MWHGLGVHWRFIQIKGGILRGSSSKRCVNCEKLVKQGPQVTDHLRMVKLNAIIDRSHKLLDVVMGIGRRDGMIL